MYVYVYDTNISEGDQPIYKIGVTNDYEQRSRPYQTAIPNFSYSYLTRVCHQSVEKEVHNRLNMYRYDFKHEFFCAPLSLIIQTVLDVNEEFLDSKKFDERLVFSG